MGTLPFNCNNKRQDKKKARKALIDEVKPRKARNLADSENSSLRQSKNVRAFRYQGTLLTFYKGLLL